MSDSCQTELSDFRISGMRSLPSGRRRGGRLFGNEPGVWVWRGVSVCVSAYAHVHMWGCLWEHSHSPAAVTASLWHCVHPLSPRPLFKLSSFRALLFVFFQALQHSRSSLVPWADCSCIFSGLCLLFIFSSHHTVIPAALFYLLVFPLKASECFACSSSHTFSLSWPPTAVYNKFCFFLIFEIQYFISFLYTYIHKFC